MRSPSDATPGELQALPPVLRTSLTARTVAPAYSGRGRSVKDMQAMRNMHKLPLRRAQYATPLPWDDFDR